MTRRLPRRRVWMALVVALGAAALAFGHQPAHTTPAGQPAVVLAGAQIPTTQPPSTGGPSTTLPQPAAGGQGPPPIQVGPPIPVPTPPGPGSGGNLNGGGAPSPGLFDITGHIEAAIDSWFRDLVTAALNPVLTLLGHSLLSTPNVTAQDRVGSLWQMTAGIADGFLVLFVLVGAAIVMAHETLQTRTAVKDLLPRIVVAAVAANASLAVVGLGISAVDALSQAVLGQGVGPAQAAVVLRQLVLGGWCLSRRSRFAIHAWI